MADIMCPICPPQDSPCEHDQEERKLLCREMGVPEVLEPEVYDSTNVEHINRRRNKGRRAESEDDADLKAVMQLPAGRRFIARLFTSCGIHAASFKREAPDPYITAFLEGQRAVALTLLTQIDRAAPAEYLVMLKEKTRDVA